MQGDTLKLYIHQQPRAYEQESCYAAGRNTTGAPQARRLQNNPTTLHDGVGFFATQKTRRRYVTIACLGETSESLPRVVQRRPRAFHRPQAARKRRCLWTSRGGWKALVQPNATLLSPDPRSPSASGPERPAGSTCRLSLPNTLSRPARCSDAAKPNSSASQTGTTYFMHVNQAEG